MLFLLLFFCIVFFGEISWSCCAGWVGTSHCTVERWVVTSSVLDAGTGLGARAVWALTRERTRVSTARAAERVGPWGCGRVFHNSRVRKWETESLYLKGTRTCDSLRLAHHPIAGDQKFSKFPTSFIDPEVAFEVRHLWEWKILSSAKGCDGWLQPKSEWCSFFCLRATNLPTFENQFLIRENYETDRLISDDQTLWKHISISAHLTSCPYSFKASSPSH